MCSEKNGKGRENEEVEKEKRIRRGGKGRVEEKVKNGWKKEVQEVKM